MNPKLISTGLVLLGIFWIYSAMAMYARGKTGLCVAYSAVAVMSAAAAIRWWLRAKKE